MINLIVIWFVEWLWCLSSLLVKPRMLTYDKGFQIGVKRNKFDNNAYQGWIKRTFSLKSDFGYPLSCELYEPSKNTKEDGAGTKIAILCHGLGCAKYESIKYAEMFLKLGFTVLAYDHRNHGLSGKACTTMGYYEKFDLRKVVSWCINTYGKDVKIVTHGESMGASTVLMHLEIDQRVACVIADCAYSDLKVLLRHQLKQYYHLPRFLIPIENYIIFLRAGFWLKQVSPIKIVSKAETPVLFIHGKRDGFVPTYMSKDMYAWKKKNKAIYLVARAKHAESYYINRKGYEEKVEEFLRKYMK